MNPDEQEIRAGLIFRLTRTTTSLLIIAAVAFPLASAVVLLDRSPVGASVVSPTAYVANSHSYIVTPIAMTTNTPGTAITVGAAPSGIAITPDGKTAYRDNRSGDVSGHAD